MQQRSEDEEKKGAASKRQTSVAESFGTDRHLTGTERVMLRVCHCHSERRSYLRLMGIGLCDDAKISRSSFARIWNSFFIELKKKNLHWRQKYYYLIAEESRAK